MAAIVEALDHAKAYHRAGQLQRAEELYREILQTDPVNADVYYLLGAACQTLGRLDEAAASLQQAVRLSPGHAAAHNHLGVVLVQQGRLREAMASFQAALRLKPDFAEARSNLRKALSDLGRSESQVVQPPTMQPPPDQAAALNNRGTALAQQGKLDEAAACYRRALELRSDFAEAHNNLGSVLVGQRNLGEAAACYRQALQLKPDFAEAHFNLGTVLRRLDRPGEAIPCLRQAVQLKPDFAAAHLSLGNALRDDGLLSEAAASYQEALRLKPDYAEAYNNLSVLRKEQGNLDEAVACCQSALRLKPELAEAHSNLGIALHEKGCFDQAMACYRRALELQPDYADAHWNRALIRLLTGDWKQGWPEYQWRWQTKQFPPRGFSQPLWDGRRLGGKTILLHAEQGLGDTLQFIRYAPLVKQPEATVVVECQQPLQKLLAGCPGIDRLVGRGDSLPAFDVHAPLLSLPEIFQTSLENVPADIPYLSAAAPLVQRWRERVSKLAGLKIGICWQGSPVHRSDRYRSIPLARFAGLAQVPGVCLISLQKGAGAEQLAEVRDRFAGVDFGGELDEASGPFMDTAAIITNLDLVVTCDTAVAHLAGALGVAVWVALPFVPDWRWLLARADSPWYPTLRLFRQARPGDWEDVFRRIADALQALPPTPGPRQPAARETPGGGPRAAGYRGPPATTPTTYVTAGGPAEAFMAAQSHHRAGQLQRAEEIYREILQTDPANANVYYFLGAACQALGKLDEAVASLQQAVRLRPDHAATHNHLGVTLAQQGRPQEAIASFQEALRLKPDFAEARNNLRKALADLGRSELLVGQPPTMQRRVDPAAVPNNRGAALAQQGKWDEAAACYRQALELRPDHATAHNNLGNVLKEQGKLSEAIDCYRRALRLRPDFAGVHNNLALVLQEQGKLDEAAACCRRALELKPDYADARINLGLVLKDQGKLSEAVTCWRRALEIKPDSVEAYNNLGVVLREQGDPEEAAACCRRALALKPDYPEAYINLGVALKTQGKLAEATACYRRALELKPHSAEAHFGLAVAHLLSGDFQQGWPAYQWRWQTKQFTPRHFSQPLWDGRCLQGKTILLHAEQGLGDVLQFIRYAPLVKQREATVVVECQRALLPLLATCAGIDRLLGRGDALPAFDVQAPLLSLPGILQTSLESVPADIPYLFASEALVQQWRERLGRLAGLKIGIGWQGSLSYRGDRYRSIPLPHFAPLTQAPGVCLMSLQKGVGSEQLGEVRDRFPVVDFGSELDEAAGAFMDTAAIMMNLDLVVTSDSALAHLAGALGVPTWVALPFVPDWRWLLGRDDSPWYPTMRLFRQQTSGDWPGVFAEIHRALCERVSR
jgi:tetratricopeptide (TPR) repeat protein